MSERLPPEQLEDLLAGYVLGNLTPEEAQILHQQLADYPDLNAELQKLQDVLGVMPYALPEAVPSESVRTTLVQTAVTPGSKRTFQPVLFPTSRPSGQRRSWSPRQWGIPLTAAALIAGAIGLDNLRLRHQVATLQAVTDSHEQVVKGLKAELQHKQDVIAMLERPNTQLVALRGMDDMNKAYGCVVVTAGDPSAVLMLKNLPALDSGKTYQIWSIVEGKKVAGTAFNTDPSGKAYTKLTLPIETAVNGFVITLEATPQPKAPTGPMVMASTL
jgi:hypothetical protein